MRCWPRIPLSQSITRSLKAAVLLGGAAHRLRAAPVQQLHRRRAHLREPRRAADTHAVRGAAVAAIGPHARFRGDRALRAGVAGEGGAVELRSSGA